MGPGFPVCPKGGTHSCLSSSINPHGLFSFKAVFDGERCLFEHSEHVGSCECSGKFISITDARLNNIIEKSKLRNDLLHVDIEKFRSQNADKYHI